MSELKTNSELINVYFPSKIEEGEEFKSWPYHITIMPWYEMPIKKAITVADETSKLAVPFRVRLGDKLMFGQKNDVPVYDIVPKSLISALHEIMLEAMHKEGAQITSEQYCGENYRPHMTIQTSQPELTDKVYLVDNITVVEKLNHGFRQVVHIARIYG